jgi:hypothetical protein
MLVPKILDLISDAITDGMTAAGYDPPGAPYLTHSKPVIDWTGNCDRRLAVYLDGITARGFGARRPGSPGDLQKPGIHSILGVRAQLWECVANIHDSGAPASLAEQSADARLLLDEAWSAWVEIANRRKLGTLLAGLGVDFEKDDIGLDQMIPLAGQGYMAGWQINIEIGLPFLLEGTPPGS